MSRPIPLSTALMLLAAAFAHGGEPRTPWPRGGPPSSAVVDALVAEAEKVDAREHFEEWLNASETGEASDHLPILQADIDAGRYTRDDLFGFGDEFFEHAFTVRPRIHRDGHYVTLRRVHSGVRGGLDTFSCRGCHSVGGVDGAGSQTQNALIGGDGDTEASADRRNAPALLGSGILQGLANEMSLDLQDQRNTAAAKAARTGKVQETPLSTHGVSFGSLSVRPDGQADTSRLEGIDADLVVKPVGWKGTTARLRRFVEDAARLHFGIQSHLLCLAYRQKPEPALLGPGPKWWDPDNDGSTREMEEGILTATAVYLAMLETPVVIPPADPGLRDRWARGSALFTRIGCATCHLRDIVLRTSTWNEKADTTDGVVTLNLLRDGEPPRGSNRVNLFSDLKRHAMGPALADAHDNAPGIARDAFLTRPLWGLAETPPYLHDGRAATIPEAIVAHGGEAQPSRDAFVALPAEEKADLHIFLLSLTREPKVRVAK